MGHIFLIFISFKFCLAAGHCGLTMLGEETFLFLTIGLNLVFIHMLLGFSISPAAFIVGFI